MNTIRRAALVAVLALSACATGAAPHGPLKATGVASNFEGKTLYQCTASSGTQIVFSRPRGFVSALSSGGKVWVRARSLADGIGVTPSSPIPSTGALADGWMRLSDGQVNTWGIDSPDATTSAVNQGLGASQFVNALDVWCEVQGDLIVMSR